MPCVYAGSIVNLTPVYPLNNLIMRYSTLCSTAGLFIGLSGQLSAQTIQYALDTSSTSQPILNKASVLEDGSSVFLLNTANGHALVRTDALGAPIFYKQLPPDNNRNTLAADPTGGFVFVNDLAAQVFNSNMFDNDTVVSAINVSHYAENGTIDWNERIGWTMMTAGAACLGAANHSEVDIDANGNILVWTEVGCGTRMFHVLALGDEGQLTWARNYGRYAPGVSPIWDTDIVDMGLAIPSAGGAFITRLANGPPSDLKCSYLNATGDLVWANQYHYIGTVDGRGNHGAIKDVEGHLVMTGAVSINLESYGTTTIIGTNGDLLGSHLYTGANWYNRFKGGAPSASGGMMFNCGTEFFETDASGEPISAVRLTSSSTPPFDHTYLPIAFSYAQERVNLPGYMDTYHQIFGTHNYVPQFWSFNIAQPDGCMMEPFSVGHIVVPDSLFQISPDTVLVSEPSGATVQIIPFNIEDGSLMSTSDGCSLINTVHDPANGPSSFNVAIQLLASGEPITVHSTEPAQFILINSLGSMVSSGPLVAQGTILVPTNGCAAGMYTLVANDRAGRPLGAERIIVY